MSGRHEAYWWLVIDNVSVNVGGIDRAVVSRVEQYSYDLCLMLILTKQSE